MLNKITNFIKNDSRQATNLKWLITFLIFGILVVLAIMVIPWEQTWIELQKSNTTQICIALLLTIPIQLLTAWSYYIVAKKQDATMSFWQIFKINLIMVFYDIVLPSTFFVSTLRWYRYNQFSKKPAQTLTSLTYLKAFSILLTVLLSAGLLLFFDTATIKGYALSIALLIILCAIVLYLTPVICKRILDFLDQHPVKNPRPAMQTVLKYTKKILFAFTEFRNLRIKDQLLLIAIGIGMQIFVYIQYILFADSVNITLTFSQIGVMRATLLLVANLPINFSVGISLRDVTLVSLLTVIGVPLDKAAAMSIVVLVKTYIFGIIGILIEGFEFVVRRFSPSVE
jgi:Predicted integral membrane protein